MRNGLCSWIVADVVALESVIGRQMIDDDLIYFKPTIDLTKKGFYAIYRQLKKFIEKAIS